MWHVPCCSICMGSAAVISEQQQAEGHTAACADLPHAQPLVGMSTPPPSDCSPHSSMARWWVSALPPFPFMSFPFLPHLSALAPPATQLMGPIAGMLVGSALVEGLGWRSTLWALVVCGAVTWAGIAAFYRWGRWRRVSVVLQNRVGHGALRGALLDARSLVAVGAPICLPHAAYPTSACPTPACPAGRPISGSCCAG